MFYPRPMLPDMPFHIKSKIVDFVDIPSRFSLRNTCKKFRGIIDDSFIFYTEVSLDITDTFMLTVRRKESMEKFQLTSRHVSRVITHLEVMFKNPKAQFDQLLLNRGVDEVLEPFKTLLTSLAHQLSVEFLLLDVLLNEEDLLTILPCFEPGVLMYLNFGNLLEEGMDRVAELDQWKQAKEALLNGCTLPIDKLLHFQSLGLYGEYYLFLGHVEMMINQAIQHAESFKFWEIYPVELDEEVYEEFAEEGWVEVPDRDYRLKMSYKKEKFRLESSKYYKSEESSDEEEEEEEDMEDEGFGGEVVEEEWE